MSMFAWNCPVVSTSSWLHTFLRLDFLLLTCLHFNSRIILEKNNLFWDSRKLTFFWLHEGAFNREFSCITVTVSSYFNCHSLFSCINDEIHINNNNHWKNSLFTCFASHEFGSHIPSRFQRPWFRHLYGALIQNIWPKDKKTFL